MVQTVLNEILRLKAVNICEKNESLLREGIQNLFLYAECDEIKKDSELKRLILNEAGSLLRSVVNNSDAKYFNEECDLWEMTDEICLAADLYLCGSGKRLIFTTPELASTVNCSAEAFSASLLNLISNAYIHSSGEFVGVSLEKMNGLFILKVSCDGYLNLSKAIQSMKTAGTGLWKAKRAAETFGGKIFLCRNLLHNHAVITVPFSNENNLPLCEFPDFSILLCDRCSPVNIQLSIL